MSPQGLLDPNGRRSLVDVCPQHQNRKRSNLDGTSVRRRAPVLAGVSRLQCGPYLSKSPTGPAGSLFCGPSNSFRVGLRVCASCATLQTLVCIVSVFLWPALSWSPICGGIPHLAEL